jgi:hypothetical protein
LNAVRTYKRKKALEKRRKKALEKRKRKSRRSLR